MKMILHCFLGILLLQAIKAQSGCKRIGNVIDCANLGLSSVPDFSSEPNAGRVTYVNLENNNIQTISAHAFNGIAPTEINLERNYIRTIQNGAFDAVYSKLLKLRLAHNQLVNLPMELGKLDNLTYLDIKDNAFTDGTSLDHGSTDTVFRLLGDSLKEFHFGERFISTWPQVALTHFPKLEVLNVQGGYISFIPFNGFHGFEHTLKKLYISETSLRQIPLAISTLTQLIELHFDDNQYVRDTGILSQAFTTTTQRTSPLKVLSLRNNSLTRFPAVLRNLVNLKELDMGNNKLWYVADDALNLLISSSIVKMGLSGCSLDRIPQALLKLPTMADLDLSNNNIQSVERYDLSNQTTITKLNMSHNPLAYISTEAFKRLPILKTLDFSSTAMTEIPRAILNTPALTTMKFENDRIECTCDLIWIPQAVRTRITFGGICETIEKPIDSYVKQRLLTCPSSK